MNYNAILPQKMLSFDFAGPKYERIKPQLLQLEETKRFQRDFQV